MELEGHLPHGLASRLRALGGIAPVRFMGRLIAHVGEDDVPGLAAEMAYRFLFAFFPFLIFLTAIIGFITAAVGYSNLFTLVMDLLRLLFPPEVQRILEEWVSGVLLTQSTGLLTFGAAGALWGAAGGVGTFIKGLNRAYRVPDDRPFWARQTLSLLATIGMALIMILGVGLFTFGHALGEGIASGLGLGSGFVVLWDWIRVPAVNLGLLAALALMYRVLPNARVSWRGALPGAILATAGWVALTTGFGTYVAHFGSYDRTFGSLGAAVLLMVWMYAIAMILLLGGELNSALGGRYAADRPPDARSSSTAAAT